MIQVVKAIEGTKIVLFKACPLSVHCVRGLTPSGCSTVVLQVHTMFEHTDGVGLRMGYYILDCDGFLIYVPNGDPLPDFLL